MAVSTSQGRVCAQRKGGVRFWAWTSSIAVHLIVLLSFGAVKFSGSKVYAEQEAVPAARINQVKKLIQVEAVIPKPKLKKPGTRRFVGMAKDLLPANTIFEGTMAGLQAWPNFMKPSSARKVFGQAGGVNMPEGVEFFGSFTAERKVCYVVDCSGSMRGIFGRVRKRLKESIGRLQADQYFYIIFFGGGKVLESGSGRLVRATPDAKSKVNDFIDSIQPAGRTNALAAWERAVQIRDSYGDAPSVVYFLTDGFELTTADALRFSQNVSNLLLRFAPTTRVNTIGFWPQSDDCKMLQRIASESGGEFIIVDDGSG